MASVQFSNYVKLFQRSSTTLDFNVMKRVNFVTICSRYRPLRSLKLRDVQSKLLIYNHEG